MDATGDDIADLADHQAIRRLVDEYAMAADHRDPERFAAVFTADATLTGTHRRYEGAAEIATITAMLERYESTFHLVGGHVAWVDGDTATAETTCDAHHRYRADDIERDRVLHIRYLDRLVRTAAGWRIAERHLEVSWVEDRPIETR